MVANFRPIHGEIDVDDVDVHVVINGVSLFDQVVATGHTAAPAFMNLALQAGDVLDFVIGVGGKFGGDSTAFNATVMPAGRACAVTWVETLANHEVVVPRDNLLATCTDLAGSLLSVFAVKPSASGASVALVDGEALYTPLPDFVGADRFSYTVTDENGHYATRVVDVLVTPDTASQPTLIDPQYRRRPFRPHPDGRRDRPELPHRAGGGHHRALDDCGHGGGGARRDRILRRHRPAQRRSLLPRRLSLIRARAFRPFVKRLLVCALLLAAVESASPAATAGTDLTANEKPDDAGDSQNPNPTVPQWSYGYRTSATGTALTLFAASDHTDNYISANDPMEGFYKHNPYALPAVLVNTGPTPFTFNFGAGPVAPSEIMMHGSNGIWSVVRYTIPAAGSYNVTASFRPIQGGSVDAHVVSNGVPLFDQVLTNTQSAAPSFSNLVLAAGTLLDFVVGVSGQLNADSTAFNATIVTNAIVNTNTNTNTFTVLLTTDPDFGAQTLDAGLGAPWSWASSYQHLVDASGQSPFTNLFAHNGKGVSLPASSGNPYFVQGGFNVGAGATGYVSLAFDFRNTTADPDGWTVFLTTNADARLATVGLYITGNGFYALSSGGWSASLFSPVVGEWYHAQVLLDLTANTYSGTLQAF